MRGLNLTALPTTEEAVNITGVTGAHEEVYTAVHELLHNNYPGTWLERFEGSKSVSSPLMLRGMTILTLGYIWGIRSERARRKENREEVNEA